MKLDKLMNTLFEFYRIRSRWEEAISSNSYIGFMHNNFAAAKRISTTSGVEVKIIHIEDDTIGLTIGNVLIFIPGGDAVYGESILRNFAAPKFISTRVYLLDGTPRGLLLGGGTISGTAEEYYENGDVYFGVQLDSGAGSTEVLDSIAVIMDKDFKDVFTFVLSDPSELQEYKKIAADDGISAHLEILERINKLTTYTSGRYPEQYQERIDMILRHGKTSAKA